MEENHFNIQEELKKLPGRPGVYIMHDEKDHIIYVGKAISLKNRVRQYFQSSYNKSVKIQQMVTHIRRFEYIVTDSELEALVLECNLIKEHRPKYNTMLMDDKSYPFIKVTTGEPAQNAVPAADLTPATPVGKASADMPGYTEIDLKQIPGDVYALMGNGKLVISIGKDEFNMTNMTANAGGALGYQNGKAVAYCTLSADQPYEAIEKAETYTLKLYAPNQTTPSAVIECKKLPSQTTPQAGQPRTYVGEIVKLLMKK